MSINYHFRIITIISMSKMMALNEGQKHAVSCNIDFQFLFRMIFIERQGVSFCTCTAW
jgi:hypothetical protein